MRRNSRINILLYALVGIAAVLLDQLTKLICLNNLALGESAQVIPGVLDFTYIQNRGAAFGSLANSRWIFMILSTVMIIVLTVYVVIDKSLSKPALVCLGMIAGGGVGNMIDRVAYGYVVDFIDVKFLPFWKWIFNVADSFVCVGAVLLLMFFIIHEIKNKKENKNDVNTEL